MSAYTAGTAFGMRLARRLPYKIRIALGLFLTLFLLVVLGLFIYKSSLEKLHYKQLMAMADDILAAEQKYFAKKGDYTADLRFLDYKLPASSTDEEYRPSRYVEDAGEKILSSERFSFNLENGDSVSVTISRDFDSDDGANSFKYSVLDIWASGKFRSLPASYNMRIYFNHGGLMDRDLLKLCNVSILNASKAERDIQNGGKFCRSLGAFPTGNEIIWIFQN